MLTPRNWQHQHKERLRKWYVDKLGYELKLPGDYDASTTRVLSGETLVPRELNPIADMRPDTPGMHT